MSNDALFAAPIPEECRSVGETIQKVVEISVQRAEVDEKEVIPWVLKWIGELSGGKYLANSTSLCSCHTVISICHVSQVWHSSGTSRSLIRRRFTLL